MTRLSTEKLDAIERAAREIDPELNAPIVNEAADTIQILVAEVRAASCEGRQKFSALFEIHRQVAQESERARRALRDLTPVLRRIRQNCHIQHAGHALTVVGADDLAILDAFLAAARAVLSETKGEPT